MRLTQHARKRQEHTQSSGGIFAGLRAERMKKELIDAVVARSAAREQMRALTARGRRQVQAT